MVLIPEIRSIDFSIPISSVGSILFLVEPKRTGHKSQLSYNLEWKREQCKSGIRQHLLYSPILDYTVHKKRLMLSPVRKEIKWLFQNVLWQG